MGGEGATEIRHKGKKGKRRWIKGKTDVQFMPYAFADPPRWEETENADVSRAVALIAGMFFLFPLA